MAWIFSGEATADLDALDIVLAGARAVRVTGGGCLVYAVNRGDNVLDPDVPKLVQIMDGDALAFETDPQALLDLRAALRVVSYNNFETMYPGDYALEFLDGDGKQLTVVRIDAPDLVDWPLWVGKAYLANAAALESWLAARGADGPLIRDAEHRRRWTAPPSA
jgi:hypothetical protein